MQGKFYAVGVGPGDPGLVTLKALKIMEGAGLLVATRTDRETDCQAFAMIRPLLAHPGHKYFSIVLPVRTRCHNYMDIWLEAVNTILKSMENGQEVVFVTPGDPTSHNVLSYLLDIMEGEKEGFDREILPGINFFSAGASFLNNTLVMEDEKLAVIPAPVSRQDLAALLRMFDAIVITRAHNQARELPVMLEDLGMEENACYLGYHPEKYQFSRLEPSSLKGDFQLEQVYIQCGHI